MRNFNIAGCAFFCLLLAGCLGAQGPSAQSPSSPTVPSVRDLRFAPLEFHVPEVQRLSLDNGMRLYLQEDHELPLVDVTVMLGAGAIGDPADITGRTDLYADLLRSGGAGTLSPDEVDEFLDMKAADLSVSADPYAVTLKLSLRAADLAEGIALLADVLRRPGFDEGRLDVTRRQAVEAVRRQNDDPGHLARRILSRVHYGDHPLGRTPTVASLQAVTRSDLLDFHRQHAHPNNLWMGITGDFDRSRLSALLQEHFGEWQPVTYVAQTIPPLAPVGEPAIWTVSRPLPQTTILFGEIGIDKDNPDQYALRVMNYLLGGGGFNSRLMREIRSNRGLTYSVYSFYQVGRRLPGLFIAGSETRTEATPQVLSLMRDIMNGLRDEPVSADELALARESLINSFVFGFTDLHEVVAMTMRLDFYDYPADYLTAYRDRVAEVGVEDVQRVARRYLNPQSQMLVLVGDIPSLAEELAALGLPVREFPLED